MSAIALTCINQTCSAPTSSPVANPPMDYDSTNGGTTYGATPTSLGISPPFTNLPAQCYDINGIGKTYGWNQAKGIW